MYIDVEYVRKNTSSPLIRDLPKEEDFKIENAIMFAQDIIEVYTNQKFDVYMPDTELIINGNGSTFVQLPYNIIKIEEIYNDIYRLRDFELTKYMIISHDGKFVKGFKNVKIFGSFGWEEIPQAIKYYTFKLAESLLIVEIDPELSFKIYGPFESERIGDYSYKLKGKSSYEDSTGIASIDVALDKYRCKMILIEVI